jgi:hypothetical protein
MQVTPIPKVAHRVAQEQLEIPSAAASAVLPEQESQTISQLIICINHRFN